MIDCGIFKPALLRWQLRQLFAVNALAVLLASLYVLLRTKPMVAPDEVELVAVLVHSGLIVWRLGRVSARHTGFLYTLGLTRDQIGSQTLLASAISGVLVCGTAWLIMVTSLRSAVQDIWYQNMYFPFIAPEEYLVPWVWLFTYAIILPLMHYVWIRGNQPCQGGASGWMLLIVGLYFHAWAFDRAQMHVLESTFLFSLAAMYIPAVLLLVVACLRLHRTMEIRK